MYTSRLLVFCFCLSLLLAVLLLSDKNVSLSNNRNDPICLFTKRKNVGEWRYRMWLLINSHADLYERWQTVLKRKEEENWYTYADMTESSFCTFILFLHAISNAGYSAINDVRETTAVESGIKSTSLFLERILTGFLWSPTRRVLMHVYGYPARGKRNWSMYGERKKGHHTWERTIVLKRKIDRIYTCYTCPSPSIQQCIDW